MSAKRVRALERRSAAHALCAELSDHAARAVQRGDLAMAEALEQDRSRLVRVLQDDEDDGADAPAKHSADRADTV